MIVLEALDLAKVYRGGDGGEIAVLDGINLGVERGEMVAVVGSSGAGKSTLLHLLGALDQPTRGEVRIGGQRTAHHASVKRPWHRVWAIRRDRREERKADEQLSELRNRSVGFVFQFHHLLREFTALENVMMPMRIAGWDDQRADARARDLLGRVGLGARTSHRPSELSGGEQQRTAVARALALEPAVLLADEPSGNLDHANSERLHDLFAQLSSDLEIAMVIATHNRSLAARAHRTLTLEDGTLTETDVREVVP